MTSWIGQRWPPLEHPTTAAARQAEMTAVEMLEQASRFCYLAEPGSHEIAIDADEVERATVIDPWIRNS